MGTEFGSVVAQLTPGPISQGMAGLAGVAMTPAMRAKRSMIERHLRRVDPTLSGLALRRKVQQAFESYSRYWVESFRLPNLSKRTVERTFSYTGYREYLLPALEAGNGCIIALPHLGGWEWAGRWIADRGHPITVVVEPLENAQLFEWFADLRAKLGMTVVPLGPDAGAAVLRALRNNEVVCLLSDRDLTHDGVSRSSSSASARPSRRGPPPCRSGREHRSCQPPCTSPGATTDTTRSCAPPSPPSVRVGYAKTSPGSPRTSPASSNGSSAEPPSSGTSSSPTGHPTPDMRSELIIY